MYVYVYVHMRDGSDDRRVIFDADSLCTKDIALYEQHIAPPFLPVIIVR